MEIRGTAEWTDTWEGGGGIQGQSSRLEWAWKKKTDKKKDIQFLEERIKSRLEGVPKSAFAIWCHCNYISTGMAAALLWDLQGSLIFCFSPSPSPSISVSPLIMKSLKKQQRPCDDYHRMVHSALKYISWNVQQSFLFLNKHTHMHKHTQTHTHLFLLLLAAKRKAEWKDKESSHTWQNCFYCSIYSRVFLRGGGGGDTIALNRKSLHCTSPVARKLQLKQQCNAAQQLSP